MSNVVQLPRVDEWAAQHELAREVLVDDRDEAGVGLPPPNDMTAEASTISAALLDAKALERVSWLKPDEFFSEAHRRIWEAVLWLRERGEPVDVTTVLSRLKDARRLEQVGGAAYLTELLVATPAVVNVTAHARIVQKKALVRGLLDALRKAEAEAYVDHGDDLEWVRGTVRGLARFERAASHREVASNLERLKEIGREMHEHAQAVGRGERARTNTGLATGITSYDRLTGGLHGGHLTVVAARPGKGKTAIGLQIAAHVAATRIGERRVGVAFFELEMTHKELLERAVAQRARVNMRRAVAGELTPAGHQRMTLAMQEISGWPLVIDDTQSRTIDDLRGAAISLLDDDRLAGAPLGLVVVDYLQKLKPPAAMARAQRHEYLREAVVGLKELATMLKVPVIALAQLSRASEREDREPRFSDIEYCPDAEKEADEVVFLHAEGGEGGAGRRRGRKGAAPDYPYGAPSAARENATTLILAKQRGGEIGRVELEFQKEFTRFVEGDHEEQGAFDGI